MVASVVDGFPVEIRNENSAPPGHAAKIRGHVADFSHAKARPINAGAQPLTARPLHQPMSFRAITTARHGESVNARGLANRCRQMPSPCVKPVGTIRSAWPSKSAGIAGTGAPFHHFIVSRFCRHADIPFRDQPSGRHRLSPLGASMAN